MALEASTGGARGRARPSGRHGGARRTGLQGGMREARGTANGGEAWRGEGGAREDGGQRAADRAPAGRTRDEGEKGTEGIGGCALR